MSLQAFGPRGKTVMLAVTSTAHSWVQVTALIPNCYTYQFINSGTSACWFWFSKDGSGSLPVGVPVDGTPAYGVAVLPNEIVIYNCAPDAYFSAICSGSDTTSLQITPGEGM